MSTADDARTAMLYYRDGYDPFSKDVVGDAFMAGYRRALEDAADASEDTDAMDYWVGILSEDRQWSGVAGWLRDRAAEVGTKD